MHHNWGDLRLRLWVPNWSSTSRDLGVFRVSTRPAEAYPAWMRALLHAEPCASHGFDRRIRPAHLDLCRAMPHPPMDGDVVDLHFALGQQLFNIPMQESIA